MSEPVTQDDLDEALTNLRADQAVVIARIYDDFRRELKLELKSFKNEMRVLLVGAFVVIGFDVPKEITVGAIGIVVLGALKSAVMAHFTN